MLEAWLEDWLREISRVGFFLRGRVLADLRRFAGYLGENGWQIVVF
jgi:hypothetical protein